LPYNDIRRFWTVYHDVCYRAQPFPVNLVQLIKALLPNYPCCSDRLFVFPSLYEGLGLPVLEAMACGTPVVCSSTSILPEVTGDAALLVDPTDGRALAGAMERVLRDKTLRAALQVRGLDQARKFSWEDAAWKTLEEVYQRVAGSSGESRH